MLNNRYLKFVKLSKLPSILEPNRVYLIKESATIFTIYLTDEKCNLYTLDSSGGYELNYDESEGVLQLIDSGSGSVISETSLVTELSSAVASVEINSSDNLIIDFKNASDAVIDTLTISVENIQNLQSELDLKEDLSNKVDNFNSPNSTTYPTTSAVQTQLNLLEQDLEDQIATTGGNSVSYSPQSKPPSEKEQARLNIDVHSTQEIRDFFDNTTVVNGYNKSNWDDAFGWGDHSGLYEPLFSKGSLVQGSGITLSGTLTDRLISSGSLTVEHGDTSSQASSTYLNGTVPSTITLDEFGHITFLGSKNLDDRYYTETESDAKYLLNTTDTLTGTLTVIGGIVSNSINVGLTSDDILLGDATTTSLNAILDTKYVQNIGNGVDTSITVNHNFGTQDVVVQVVENSSDDVVYTDTTLTDANNVTVEFGTAPTTNQYRVIVLKR